jgi:acyl-CoA reductase-like NAD-dependent aldehyde dehydrogenase
MTADMELKRDIEALQERLRNSAETAQSSRAGEDRELLLSRIDACLEGLAGLLKRIEQLEAGRPSA